jgi:hypothetical protein
MKPFSPHEHAESLSVVAILLALISSLIKLLYYPHNIGSDDAYIHLQIVRAGIASPPLAAIEPFKRVLFMPIPDPRGSDIVAVAEHQMAGAKPVALELPHISAADLPRIAA